MKVSARRLMEHVLCPHSIRLWDNDLMRRVFGVRSVTFKSAVKTCVTKGFEEGLAVLSRLVNSAQDSPMKSGIYQKALVWYAGFYRLVDEHKLSFLEHGRRPKIRVGRHELSLEVPLIENRGDQGLAAWIFFDFVETGLRPSEYAIAVQATRWILANMDDDIRQVVFYVPQSGTIDRQAVTLKDMDWDPAVLIPWLDSFEADRVYAKRPGSQCDHCWHLKRRTCDAGRGARTGTGTVR